MSNDKIKEPTFRVNIKYAGFYPRMLAQNIDLIILLPLFYLIGYYVSQNWVLILLCSLLYTIYNTLFEISPWKGTPGKKIQKITVALDSHENQLSIKYVLIRNTSKILSAALFFSGFIMVAFDPKRRGLHDRMASTVVIFVEKKTKLSFE